MYLMLIDIEELDENKLSELLKKLSNISEEDKKYFHPQLTKATGNHYYADIKNEEIVGYGMLRTFNKYDIPMLGCIIFEKYRKKGFGSKIVYDLLKKADILGYSKVRLHVNRNNTDAYKLYSNAGFGVIHIDNDILTMEYNNGLQTYIFDIDGTFCDYISDKGDYSKVEPDENMIKIINYLYDKGHPIVIETGRGGNSGIDWKEITEKQLKEWGVKYNELKFVKKPWIYTRVDDRSKSPSQFLEELEI